MIIDFHTHAFPDAIAPRALASLIEGSGGIYPPVHDGTIGGLLAEMDTFGVDISVLQPVITKASQLHSLNEWAISNASKRIIPFGGIYPHTENYKKDIDFVASLGIKGLKFHAEYQNFVADAPEMLRIYDYAFEKGLIVLHHAGFDPAFPPPFRSSPKRFRHVIREMQGGVLVLAHLGGHAQWDDVEEYLVGENVYLDTSMGFSYYGSERFVRIARAHGADKILFGTDSPWSRADEEIRALRALPLTEEEKNAILGANAARLLGL